MTHRTTDRPVIDPADLELLEEAVGLIRSARLEDVLADLLPAVGPRELADLARHRTLVHPAVPLFTGHHPRLLTAVSPLPPDGFLLRAHRRPANGGPEARR